MHFNCPSVWSNSKWICDLSIDSYSPRLWIKCFNYSCSDVSCSLECCMWCRPLSPGKATPPPTPTNPALKPTAPPPPLPPCLPPSHPPSHVSAWHEWASRHIIGTLQTGAKRNKNWGCISVFAAPFLERLRSVCTRCWRVVLLEICNSEQQQLLQSNWFCRESGWTFCISVEYLLFSVCFLLKLWEDPDSYLFPDVFPSLFCKIEEYPFLSLPNLTKFSKIFLNIFS